jgi:hypothetical protein
MKQYKKSKETPDTVQEPTVAYERAVHTSKPIQQGEVLTYEILQQHKREQQRLVAAGLMEKPAITDDIFTPEEETEFNKGITIEAIFRKYNIPL